MVAVGVLAGLTAVAHIRAAEILMGPFVTLLAGVSQVSVPEVRVVLSDSPHRLIRFCLTLAGLQGAGAVAWTAIVFAVPSRSATCSSVTSGMQCRSSSSRSA